MLDGDATLRLDDAAVAEVLENAIGAVPLTNASDAAGSGVATDPKASTDWAKVNAVRTTVMTEHWDSDPFWRLTLTRKIQEPLLKLQEYKLKRSGPRWEMRQQAKVAKAINQGKPTEGVRDYRVLLAANNVAENVCMRSLQDLFAGPAPWRLYFDDQPDALTTSGRAKGFRMVSRAGAALEELLRKVHVGYPFTTFRLLREPDLAGKVCDDATDEECKGGLVDRWTKGMVKQFPSADALRSKDFHAILLLALQLLYMCTGTIETLHASIRRMINACSVQTHLRLWRCAGVVVDEHGAEVR